MADNFDMKKFLVENKLGAYSKLKEEKFYAPSYVAKKYGSKAKEIEDNIEDEKDNNPNIWDLYTSLETEKETDEFVKGFMNENETASNLTPLQQHIYDYEVEISGEEFANEELENIKKLNTISDVEKYYGDYRGWDTDKDFKYDLIRLIKTLKSKKLAEGEAAYEYEKGKAAGEKIEKEKLKKEDLDQDRTDAEAEKMMDFLYEKEKEEEQFGGINETVDNRTLMTVEKIQDLLKNLQKNTATNSNIPTADKQGLLGVFQEIDELLEDVGADIEMEMDDRYVPNNEELNENISPEAIDRMDGLVPQTALKALVGGAQAIIRDFKQEGFEDDEIFEFIVSKIKTL